MQANFHRNGAFVPRAERHVAVKFHPGLPGQPLVVPISHEPPRTPGKLPGRKAVYVERGVPYSALND